MRTTGLHSVQLVVVRVDQVRLLRILKPWLSLRCILPRTGGEAEQDERVVFPLLGSESEQESEMAQDASVRCDSASTLHIRSSTISELEEELHCKNVDIAVEVEISLPTVL